MASMPAFSWTTINRIHHDSSGMQAGFLSSKYETAVIRWLSKQVVTLIMLSQWVSQMRGQWLRLSNMNFCCRRRYATIDVKVELNVLETANYNGCIHKSRWWAPHHIRMNPGLAMRCFRVITTWCFPVILFSTSKDAPITTSRQSE